jgi:hypothetical protein
VVLDSFGIMHEPDQRSAFAQRTRATASDGVLLLLLQYHSIATIVKGGQWNSLPSYVIEAFADSDAVLVLDETRDVKKGVE